MASIMPCFVHHDPDFDGNSGISPSCVAEVTSKRMMRRSKCFTPIQYGQATVMPDVHVHCNVTDTPNAEMSVFEAEAMIVIERVDLFLRTSASDALADSISRSSAHVDNTAHGQGSAGAPAGNVETTSADPGSSHSATVSNGKGAAFADGPWPLLQARVTSGATNRSSSGSQYLYVEMWCALAAEKYAAAER